MNSTTDLDDKIRELLEQLDQATPTPPAFAELHDYGRPTPARLVPMTAAAAIVAIGVGGLVVVNARVDAPGRQPPAASQPSPSNSAAPRAAASGDLLDISLDDWIDPSSPEADPRSWTVLDTAQLPTDVELIDELGSVVLAPPVDAGDATFAGMVAAYRYSAALRSNGTVFNLVVTSPAFGPCVTLLDMSGADASMTDDNSYPAAPTGQVHDINGERAVSDGSSLCWTVEPDVVALIAPAGSSSDDTPAAEAAADVARRVAFTQVEQLPTEPGNAESAPSSSDFAGTLNAVPWSATVSASSSRAMQVSADGRALGGFSNDRLSQPTDTPTATGDLSLTGVPGAGAIVYGYVAPDVVAVRVTSNRGETDILPVLQRENESFLAVPIPDGVVVTTLEFVRTDGSVFGLADLGPLPANLEGTYGGIIAIKPTPATTD